MFTVSFILILSLTTAINNKINEISDSNNDSYKFDRRSAIIIASLFILSIALNSFKGAFINHYWLVFGIYSAISLLSLLITNSLRIQAIKKEREEIQQVFEALETLLKTKGNIDYNNIPFKINYDRGNKNQIDTIEVKMENPEKFTDSAVTQTVYELNKFMPYRRWISETDFPERTCKFIGTKLPPKLANYPGSDLRPWNWIPLGLGGSGELGWNLGAKKSSMGRSLYIYEDTKLEAETSEVAKAPQALCVGSTGGGKAIQINEIITVRRPKNSISK